MDRSEKSASFNALLFLSFRSLSCRRPPQTDLFVAAADRLRVLLSGVVFSKAKELFGGIKSGNRIGHRLQTNHIAVLPVISSYLFLCAEKSQVSAGAMRYTDHCRPLSHFGGLTLYQPFLFSRHPDLPVQ